MARMMRDDDWVIVSPTYATEYSGGFRARDKRRAKAEIDDCFEEIDQAARERASCALIKSMAR
jgi:hypothetical protein